MICNSFGLNENQAFSDIFCREEEGRARKPRPGTDHKVSLSLSLDKSHFLGLSFLTGLMKGGGELGCVSVYQSGSNKENRNFSKYLSRGHLMQDIHTGNGGSETGHREVAQRSTPAGSHFLQEGGWREKWGGGVIPALGLGSLTLWKLEHGRPLRWELEP